jgi:cardiolipin synthase
VSIPNLLTLLRMLLVPVVIWLIMNGDVAVAFWLFLLAGVTDAADGMIAKRFNQATLLGAYLDPVADKLLLIGVFVTLGVVGALPSWLVILVVSRDVMIMIAFAIAYLVSRPIRVRPLLISKINTAAQITLAAGELLTLGGIATLPGDLRVAAVIVVACLTSLSWAVYFLVWTTHLAGTPATKLGPREDEPTLGRYRK